MECIYEEYIKFTSNFLTNYYRILLGSKYDRKLVKPFIDRYIDIRYYNKNLVAGNDITEILGKELKNVVLELFEENENKTEFIKNIFALFSYILFIDGCYEYTDLNTLLKTLFSDSNITLEYDNEIKKELNTLVRDYLDKRDSFFELFNNNEFYLGEKQLDNNIYKIDLVQNCNLSKLYSEFAIDKAYNSEVVLENRTYLEILILSTKILKDVIALDFDKNYIVDFPITLTNKSKKIIKYLKALDDDMIKSKINLCFKYKEYRENKSDIKYLINQGYSICLELDETYDMNFDDLFLFNYILIDKNLNFYDNIINSKDDIKTTIISL